MVSNPCHHKIGCECNLPDDKKVEYAGVGCQVVDGEPSVADNLSEGPLLLNDEDGEEGHADGADDHVGDGQRKQEVVGDGLQLLVQLEADHHHQVAGYCHQAQQATGNTDQGGLKRCVGFIIGSFSCCHSCQGESRFSRPIAWSC